MNGVIWLIVLPGMLFAAGAYAQISPAPDDNGGTTPDAVPAKFDAGFYQKIQDLIDADSTGPQTSRQRTPYPDGPRGASDDQRYYNVIIVVGRDGANPDDTARQNKKSIARHLESLGARDIVAAESLSFVTASVPVSKIPGLSLREEIRQMGDGELPVTSLVGDRTRQIIHATPSDLQRSTGWEPNGTGVVVAVIDSGKINSPYLNDKVVDWVRCGRDGCWQRSGSDSSTTASHGTQVAGVLAASGMRNNNGIAPGVTLLGVVRDDWSSAVLHALDWSYSRGAAVASQSFIFSSRCEDNNSTSENMIMNEVIDKGLVVVNAAGNGGNFLGTSERYQTIGQYPCIRNIIAVGGIDTRNSPPTMYTDSSRGPISDSDPRLAPHIVAPVFGVPLLVNTIDDTTYPSSGGTSYSTPQVSATAAILLQVRPELTPAGVRAALLLGANWTGPVPCTSAQYEQNNTNDPCSFAMQPTDYGTANNASSLKILNNVGFGILNVAESLRYANSSSHIILDYLDVATRTHTYEFNVTDTSELVKVILTWMVGSHLSPADLNLEILTPEGSTIDASSIHQTTEFAVFNPNVTGTYTVIVQGSGLPDRPIQTFALAGTSDLVAILSPDSPPPATPLAIDAVGRKNTQIDRTLRIDLETSGGAGPATWSVDEKPGARIHPDTGHLVYLPPPGTEKWQTLTVRADDGNSNVYMDILIHVDPFSSTIESVKPSSQNPAVLNTTYDPGYRDTYYASFGTFSDGAFTLRSDVPFIWNNASTQSFLSYPYDLPSQPDQLHIFRIHAAQKWVQHDRSLYAQVTPRQDNFTIIPNPFTRPDPFAPNSGHTIHPGTTETITPDLVGFDGDPLAITAVTNGTQGTANHTDTTITYTPDTGAAGTDTITYTVTDNRGRTGTGTINLFPPITVNDDTALTDEDAPVNIDVLGNDTAAGVTLAASDPPNGTATIVQSNNTITYTPDRHHNGRDSFVYTVMRGSASLNATVNVTIVPVDDPVTFEVPPDTAGRDHIAINELEPFNFDTNVTNHDDIPYSFIIWFGDPPATGANITQAGNFSWTPAEEHGPGNYTAAIILTPDGRDNITQQIVLSVAEDNEPPVFNVNTTQTAITNTTFGPRLNARDADIPEQDISYNITSQHGPSESMAIINGTTGQIVWTPDRPGNHTITVEARDSWNPPGISTAKMAVHVRYNDMEVPVITLNNATQNPQIIELGDDYEELGATVSDDDPSYMGMVVIDASRVDTRSAGTYTVTYSAPADPAGKTPETVTRIVVIRDTQKPTIILTGSDGDSTVIAPVSDTQIGSVLDVYLSRGLVVLAGNPASGLGTTRGITSAGFLLAGILVNGAYADMPNTRITDSDDITVFVNELGNVPPVLSGIGDYVTNAQDTLEFTVLAIDYNDTVSYRLSGAPTGATISERGEFSWMPGSADVGTHTFAITAYDRHGATDTETVMIRVLLAGTPNEPPVAPDVTATMPPNDRVIIIPAISDTDGDPVRITGATGDAGGTVITSDNSIEYIAGPNPGAETIAYMVQDSKGTGATGTITVTIR